MGTSSKVKFDALISVRTSSFDAEGPCLTICRALGDGELEPDLLPESGLRGRTPLPCDGMSAQHHA